MASDDAESFLVGEGVGAEDSVGEDVKLVASVLPGDCSERIVRTPSNFIVTRTSFLVDRRLGVSEDGE